MAKLRHYSTRDADMLMASKTISESFKTCLPELSAIRPGWTQQFADDLSARIDQATATFLGIDAKKDLRMATMNLQSLLVASKRDLAFFKAQIVADFKKDPVRRDEILKSLGYDRLKKPLQRTGQEAFIQVLFAFGSSMTESLRRELAAKGMSLALADQIVAHAETLRQANLSQETFKESTRSVTGEAVRTFNDIYDDIMSICRIASSYYRYEPLKKALFSFSKVTGNMGSVRSAARPAVATT